MGARNVFHATVNKIWQWSPLEDE